MDDPSPAGSSSSYDRQVRTCSLMGPISKDSIAHNE